MGWTAPRVGGLVVVATALVATYAACWRAQTVGGFGPVGLSEAAEGDALTISLYEIGTVRGPDRYRLRRGSLGIEVMGPTAGLAVGDELTVHGVMHDGVLVEQWRAEAPFRAAKKGLGIAGLLLAGAVGVAAVRWRRAGLDLRG